MMTARTRVVAALGTAQTLAWASSYYLIAILADPIAESLGLERAVVFALFSGSLLISAFLGPAVGRRIDRYGGRGVLALSNFVLAAGLVLMACSQGWLSLAAAWTVLGTGMALGLYEPAFATLTSLYGRDARGAITGITLIAGFASTVGWPTTALFNDWLGWRGACLAWAGLHLVLGFPLNRFLIPAGGGHSPGQAPTQESPPEPAQSQTVAMILLAFTFGAAWFVSSAIAAHLPRLLQAAGASAAAAIAASTLLGPAQVAARLVEFGLMKKVHPLLAARFAMCLHPIGAGLLLLVGPPVAAVFAVLHGAGNGLFTIARGTLPLAIFGPQGYGYRTGILGAPARVTGAIAPFVFGYVLDEWGVAIALATSTGLMLASLGALLALRRAPPSHAAAP
jgi:predicted MFS family arabinose efflux permease